jgi:hypothetical protein
LSVGRLTSRKKDVAGIASGKRKTAKQGSDSGLMEVNKGKVMIFCNDKPCFVTIVRIKR